MDCPTGFAFARLDRPNSRGHLVKQEVYNEIALCGVGVHGPSITDEFARDRVCLRALRAIALEA